MTEWKRVVLPLCDLCDRVARFEHQAGGLRCGSCPKPEVVKKGKEEKKEKVDVMEEKYEQLGSLDFENATDANIPVNIFLHPSRHEEDPMVEDGGWVLTADNFMPRKMGCSEGAYKFFAKHRETLVHMVQKHWKPLYVVALLKIELKPEDTDGRANLYYWEVKK